MSPCPARSLPSLGELFDQHFHYVWSSLRRLGVRRVDTEDLVHEVFLRIHQHLADFDPDRPIKPWLFGFAYRVASEDRRRARHRLEVVGADIEAVEPTRADATLEAREARALADAAMSSLPIDRRALIVLHDVEGVPMPVIARELAIPLNTAYSRLRLARVALAAYVHEHSQPKRRRGLR